MISPTKVSIKNFAFVQGDSFDKLFFVPCIRFVTVQLIQKLFLLISLDVQTFISQPLHVSFPLSRSLLSLSKNSPSVSAFNRKIIIFISCIISLIIRLLQKKRFNLKVFRYSLFTFIIPQNQRLYLFHKGQNRTHFSCREFSDERIVVFILALEVRQSKTFENWFRLIFKPKLYLSASKTSNFSIKVSI